MQGHSQETMKFEQPPKGPGSAEYLYDSVAVLDYAEAIDGSTVFYPKNTEEENLDVIIFVHGYGAVNPMIFGAWIKHLVRKGNVVIYPRYQKTLFNPLPAQFADFVSNGIQVGIENFQKDTGKKLRMDRVSYIGHSYGGALVAYLANYYKKYEIPKPIAVFACEPGTGPFKDARLRSYRDLEEDIQLLVMVGNEDLTVGDELGLRIYLSSKQLKRRNFLRQFTDVFEDYIISSSHYEPYAIDMEFDNGDRNFTADRALQVAKIDAVDYYGYWKLFDALLACSRDNNYCEYAFGNSKEQTSLGEWKKGIPIRPLKVYDPKDASVEIDSIGN
ncbi:MAG: hypothetical protein AAGK97_05100 [Bacteroidota bacterium]